MTYASLLAACNSNDNDIDALAAALTGFVQARDAVPGLYSIVKAHLTRFYGDFVYDAEDALDAARAAGARECGDEPEVYRIAVDAYSGEREYARWQREVRENVLYHEEMWRERMAGMLRAIQAEPRK